MLVEVELVVLVLVLVELVVDVDVVVVGTWKLHGVPSIGSRPPTPIALPIGIVLGGVPMMLTSRSTWFVLT